MPCGRDLNDEDRCIYGLFKADIKINATESAFIRAEVIIEQGHRTVKIKHLPHHCFI